MSNQLAEALRTAIHNISHDTPTDAAELESWRQALAAHEAAKPAEPVYYEFRPVSGDGEWRRVEPRDRVYGVGEALAAYDAAATVPEAECGNTPYDEGPFTIAEAAPAPEAAKPCLIEGKCKHGSWCSEVYCQEHCKFVKEEAPAQAQQSKGDPKLLAILNAPMTLQEAYGEGWFDHEQFKNFDEAWQHSAARYKAEVKPEAQQPLTAHQIKMLPLTIEMGWDEIVRVIERAHGLGASGEGKSNG